jgi:hypothetical protein
MPMTLTRSLLAVLIPGIVAMSAWLILLATIPIAGNLYKEFPVLGNALLFAIITIAGSVCEGMGTLIETRWDQARESKYSVDRNWYEYLARPLSPETVGHRYMSRLATTLYFELSMTIAILSFGIGTIVLAHKVLDKSLCLFSVFTFISCVVLSKYFYWQAGNTHETLCKVRCQLNSRLSSSANN